MEQYNSPMADFIEFEEDDILTSSSEWGTECPYKDAGNNLPSDSDCDLYQKTDNTYEWPGH